jgi:hypothetical protein
VERRCAIPLHGSSRRCVKPLSTSSSRGPELTRLPELRKRIYDIAAHSEQHSNDRLVRGCREIRLYLQASKQPNFGLAHLSQQYLGLTRVSKAVRKEFRPVYFRSFVVVIFVRQLPRYLAAFPLTDAELNNNIHNIFQAVHSSSCTHPGVDILPLLTCDWDLHPPVLDLSSFPEESCTTPFHFLELMLEYFMLADMNTTALKMVSGIRISVQPEYRIPLTVTVELIPELDKSDCLPAKMDAVCQIMSLLGLRSCMDEVRTVCQTGGVGYDSMQGLWRDGAGRWVAEDVGDEVVDG